MALGTGKFTVDSHLGCVRQTAVGVLPADAMVLLVHADGVFDRERFTSAGGEVAVEVLDDAQAVAAQRERVGAVAHAVLARVERVLARLGWG